MIKGTLFTCYPTATDVGICCGMAAGFFGMLCWMIFCGEIGKVGMWESVGYKKHPTE